MPHWLGTLLAILAVILIAPLIGWSSSAGGRRRIKGYAAMGSMLLGFGIPFDPPARHLIEASERKVTGGDETGDPPDPEIDPQGKQDG